jgi:spermidine/putrescine transport system substrate-binding protein
MENRYMPSLIEEKLLTEIRHYKIPNFRNIALNFRDLVYDPGNRYSVPYTWGTTAMLARRDLVAEPVTRWADLWDPRYAGRVAIWRGQPREVISLTLRSLGYSANEESPEALAQVQERLIQLRPNVQFVEDTNPVVATPLLADGSVVITMGYSNDALLSRQEKLPVDYILPAEGALLWGDNYVIPASARQPDKAEQLIDFLLRPESSAKITHANYFATANEAAMQYLEPEFASDPALFPPQTAMQRTEIVLPLSVEGEELYARVWDAFLAAGD